MKLLFVFLVVLVGAALGLRILDAGYARYVEERHKAWEAGVERYEDGVRKDCRSFSTGAGEDAILLVHGFADSPAVFRSMAGALGKKGYTCRAMRFPGFAEPMEVYRKSTRAMWLESYRRELDALKQRHRRVWVIAHSTGATVALWDQQQRPGAADGLVLLAPLLEVSSKRSPVLKTRTWFELGDRLIRKADIIENPFPLDVQGEQAATLDKRDRFIPLSIYRELYGLMDEVQDGADTIEVPVMMAVSKRDLIIDVDRARQYYDNLAASRKFWYTMDRAGHVLPIDEGWEALVEGVDAFVRTVQDRPEPQPGAEAPRD